MIQDGIQQTEQNVTSFLLVGQSNMAGRGEIGEVEPISHPDCYMLRNGRWQKMSEPINPDRKIFGGEFHCGTCPGASFALRFAEHFGEKVGLIPCADGGTKVAAWQPGELLYDHAVLMTKLAERTSALGGILWHQGESDCTDADFPHYKERLLRMICAMRRALNAEHLPFLIGELSEDISARWNCGDYPKRLNAVFHELEEELPLCRVVSSKGLSLKPDGIHFDSPSLRTFGERYFEAYLQTTEKRPSN